MRLTVLAAIVLGAGAMSACGGNSPTTPSNPTTASVSIVSGATSLGANAYAPNPVTIAPGGTVTWVNNDTRAHTTTSDNSAFNSGTMAAGASFSQNFPTAGTYPYHCTFHPGMVGTVTVK